MDVLGIFVKQPTPGRVKTRLASAVGDESAARLYAAFTRDVVDRCRSLVAQRVLCFAPDDAAARTHFEPLAGDEFSLWPQPRASLGERLQSFFSERFDAGAERVVVIGSDSPTLPRSHVQEAFARLADHDCVLGPATDGGYYLVGLRRPLPIFDDVAWSTPAVLRETIDRLRAVEGATLALLPPWYDVDDAATLELLRGHLAATELAGQGGEALATRAALVGMS